MKNLENYVTFDESGKPVFDNDAFNADLDRERNGASETAMKNTEKKLRSSIEKELRDKIAEEAQLSAEEKLNKEREALAQERSSFNRERIIARYKADGLFDDDEVSALASFIGADYEKSSELADKFIAARKKRNEAYEKSVIAKFQAGQPQPTGSGSAKAGDSDAVKRAKAFNSENADKKKIELKK